jgi:hypothetical protein
MDAALDDPISPSGEKPFGPGFDRAELQAFEQAVRSGELGNDLIAQKVLGLTQILLDNFDSLAAEYGNENEIESLDLAIALNGDVNRPINDVLNGTATFVAEDVVREIGEALGSGNEDPVVEATQILRGYTPDQRLEVEAAFRAAIEKETNLFAMIGLADQLKAVELANFRLSQE